MRTLRTRTSTALLVVVGPLLVGSVCLAGFAIVRQQRADFDARLLERARGLIATFEHDASNDVSRIAAAGGLGEGELFTLWRDEGIPLARSAALSIDLPRLLPVGPELGEASLPRFRDHALPDGSDGRLVQLESPASEGAPALTVVVARDRTALDRRIGTLARNLAIGTVVLLLVLVLVTRAASGWALRPLAVLERELRTLDSPGLATLVEHARAPAELAGVVERIHHLLERLELALERERRWSSQVAHELRTPIAELRSLADVALHSPDDRGSVLEFFGDVRDIALQMEEIVDQLLEMVRSESGIENVEWEGVPVAECLESAWHALSAKARGRGIELRLEVDDAGGHDAGGHDTEDHDTLVIESDRMKLQLILANLLGNAVAHSPEGSTIVCRITRQGSRDDGTASRAAGRICLELSNPAPHLDEEDLPRLFDRFWRKDPARTGSLHAGLGLALVRALAELLEITLEPRLESGHLKLTLCASARRRSIDGSTREPKEDGK